MWGPAIHKDDLSRLTRLHNHGIRLTCGLRKYDHVSQYRAQLGWLPVDSFIKYRSLLSLFRNYYTGRGVPRNPEFVFGRTHSYATRCPVNCISTLRFKKSFSQRHFRHSTSIWWNSLPLKLFQNLNMFCRCSSFARDCCMISFNLLYLFSYKVIIVLFKFYGLCCIVN